MKHIAIIMGGFSAESEISMRSAKVVAEHLNPKKYKTFLIHIHPKKWVYITSDKNEIPVDKSDFSIVLNDKKITFDAVFNAIHGTPGENGYMQAYFELLKIPITGCSMYASALTFNKKDTLSVLKPFGIQSAKSVFISKNDTIDTDFIINKVGLPCFVKANNSGSSFGVYKVHHPQELEFKIQEAFTFDSGVLIESYLKGREVSVGVITFKGKVKVLPITEIIPENDFFDYEAKYLGKSQEITPAHLDDAIVRKIENTAKKVYSALGLRGFSRSEFIIVDDEIFLLEVNTTPGLSPQSILPQQAKQAGISLNELFENAIEEVL